MPRKIVFEEELKPKSTIEFSPDEVSYTDLLSHFEAAWINRAHTCIRVAKNLASVAPDYDYFNLNPNGVVIYCSNRHKKAFFGKKFTGLDQYPPLTILGRPL